MKCLKCLNVFEYKDSHKIVLGDALQHVAKWDICNDCRDKEDKQIKKSRSDYYKANKKHYRKLHIKYKADLTDSYVANMLADGTSLKAKDLPKVMVEVKRQTIRLKRAIKENANDRR